MSRTSIIAAAMATASLLVTLGTGHAQTGVSGQASGSAKPDTSTSGTVQGSVTTDSPSASPSLSPDQEAAKARGLEPDKKTGPDRAGEAGGAHGQHGRANASDIQQR